MSTGLISTGLIGAGAPAALAAPLPPGGVSAWGDNAQGATTVPEALGAGGVVAVAAGFAYSLALRADGTVVAWGYSDEGAVPLPGGLDEVVAIDTTSTHALALRADGNVVGWGADHYGQVSAAPLWLDDATSVAAGNGFSVALRGDGSVVHWGAAGPLAAVPAEEGLVAIAAGGDHVLALRGDGTVVAWGYDESGQLGVPPGLAGVTAITAGNGFSLALRGDGTLVGWGDNSSGQLDLPDALTGRRVVAVDAGVAHALALLDDGSVVGWGEDGDGQREIPEALAGVRVAAVSAGAFHSLALSSSAPEVDILVHGAPADGQQLLPGTALTISGRNFVEAVEASAVFGAEGVPVLTETGLDGSFSMELLVPDEAAPGPHPITVTVGAEEFTATVTVVLGLQSAVPVISGTPRVGAELTAATAGWTAGTAFEYRWLRNGRSISGATARSYQPVAADRGTRLSVRVTGSLVGHASATRTSAATPAIAAGVLAPGSATISGTLRVGAVLTAEPGAWSPAPSFKYQWYLDGTAVKKATKRSWTPPASAAGRYPSVRITASRSGFSSMTVLAQSAAVIERGAFAASPAPTITGTAQTGQTLRAVPGDWGAPKPAFRYQWLRSGVPISGATGSSYRLPVSAQGAVISVQVTATRAGYTSVRRSSAVTPAVLGTLSGPVPKISGSPRVGAVLTATLGMWTPTPAFAIRWQRVVGTTVTDIPGPEGQGLGYTVTAEDAGATIRVRVIGALAGYADLARVSVATKRVSG